VDIAAMKHEALMGQLLHEGKLWTRAFPLGTPFAANARRFREIEVSAAYPKST